MQSGNMRGTRRLAHKDQFYLRGTALQQCARGSRVLEDNSQVLLKYLKTTREFYSQVLEGNTRCFVNFGVISTVLHICIIMRINVLTI